MPIQPGETILGKYRIERLIGEGGMARVWLAEEFAFGQRLVALKEPRADLPLDAVADVQQRYQREVQVCAALEQARVPHIVRAVTAEPWQGSILLSLVYMPGGDLATLLQSHPRGLPLAQAIAIARAVLEALAGAHGHALEIVHRDVKPSNILFDGQGTAYLGDFGLAQIAGASVGRSQLRGGAQPGTPLYMAPEQANNPGYLGPAADLFALGCVLFEMVTGQRYKRQRPGTAARSLRADTPAWLDAVLARALAADPFERWGSAGEMSAALAAGEAAAQENLQEDSRNLLGFRESVPPPSQQIKTPGISEDSGSLRAERAQHKAAKKEQHQAEAQHEQRPRLRWEPPPPSSVTSPRFSPYQLLGGLVLLALTIFAILIGLGMIVGR